MPASCSSRRSGSSVSRGLISPRARPAALGDFGTPATAVAGQRVGARRRRPRPPVRWPRALGVAALLVGTVVAGVLGGHWMLTTPHFAVTAVDVRGASRVPPTRVLEVAGIVRGTNLWRIDPDRVRARLEALPEIRRADVVRELPNRV